MRVAGVDGCKSGWVAVIAENGGFRDARALVSADLRELVEAEKLDLVLVDMPIGFGSSSEPRVADQAARDFVKGRQSSVFPTPCRAALVAENYEDACAINLSEFGKSLSKQTWALFPKLNQIDHITRTIGQSRIREGHPEVSFTAAAGKAMPFYKKDIKGLFQRLDVLTGFEFRVSSLADQLGDQDKVGSDDLIDAAILCWSAHRVSLGMHQSFPPHPKRDAAGLEMAILA